MYLSARNISCWIVAQLLTTLGAVRFAKRRALNGPYILSVYFHNPSKEEFERCIEWFKKNGFTFLSLADMEEIIQRKVPFPKGAVLLTVDDGWHSNEDNIVAAANKHNVPVAIFVSTAPVEEGVFWWSYCNPKKVSPKTNNLSLSQMKRLPNQKRLQQLWKKKQTVALQREAMTIEQIRRVAQSKYVTIGGHTHNHPVLTNCSSEEMHMEISLCKKKLEAWVDKNVTYFSYPHGEYSLREVEELKENAFSLAFGINQDYLTPEHLNDPFGLPRFCFVEGASFAENLCRITGIWKFSKQWFNKRF